jgi:hypothetical protein
MNMETVDEKLDKFIVLLDAYLDNVPEEELGYVAQILCNRIVISSTNNHLESMGLIECLKLDFQRQFDEMCADEAKKAKRKKKATLKVG